MCPAGRCLLLGLDDVDNIGGRLAHTGE
jgi:hypothetical protein